MPLSHFALSLSSPISQMCQDNVLRGFEQKQDAMQRMLEEDRDRRRRAAEVQQPPVKKPPEQEEAKIQDQQEAPEKKKSNKLFPGSALFKEWGENLSEDDQREAEALFKKYGYNVFLSDRLPLDRALPDTRDPKYGFLSMSYDARPVNLLRTASPHLTDAEDSDFTLCA